MSSFLLYFELGIRHILDITGYDHMLFVVLLAIPFGIKDWQHILKIVTAFTVGHSLTLVLVTLQQVNFPTGITELLISLSILATAIFRIIELKTKRACRNHRYFLAIAATFGLIHGLGFANYLGLLLSKEDSLVAPLFAFNVGLEIGQITIIAIFLLLNFLFVSVLRVKQKSWQLIISSLITILSFTIVTEAVF